MIVTRDDWIAALESGEYKKGLGTLRDCDDTFCCLGVLADVIDSNAWVRRTSDELSWFVWKNFGFSAYIAGLDGLTQFAQVRLAAINDEANTFEPSIKWIKENLPEVIYDGS